MLVCACVRLCVCPKCVAVFFSMAIKVRDVIPFLSASYGTGQSAQYTFSKVGCTCGAWRTIKLVPVYSFKPFRGLRKLLQLRSLNIRIYYVVTDRGCQGVIMLWNAAAIESWCNGNWVYIYHYLVPIALFLYSIGQHRCESREERTTDQRTLFKVLTQLAFKTMCRYQMI